MEFAARGFDGAKVDRIAARASVNKAMLYYHFTNKAALYREILRDVFGAVAEAVEPVSRRGGTPEAQLLAFIRAIATNAVAQPHFAPIWLREIAEGGRHLDRTIVAEIDRVLRALVAILDRGRRGGRFRRVHPLIVQMAIVAPLLLFAASAPARARLRAHSAFPAPGLTLDVAVEYVHRATLGGLAGPAATS